MKNQEMLWKTQCLRFAEALVTILDGMEEHELHAQTGLSPQECSKIFKAKEDALLMLNSAQKP